MKQLRIYTLKNENIATEYFRNHWINHLQSLPKFNIAVNSVYQGKESDSNKVFAIVTYMGDIPPNELTKQFMESSDFINDMKGFDMKNIINVDEFYISEPFF